MSYVRTGRDSDVYVYLSDRWGVPTWKIHVANNRGARHQFLWLHTDKGKRYIPRFIRNLLFRYSMSGLNMVALPNKYAGLTFDRYSIYTTIKTLRELQLSGLRVPERAFTNLKRDDQRYQWDYEEQD